MHYLNWYRGFIRVNIDIFIPHCWIFTAWEMFAKLNFLMRNIMQHNFVKQIIFPDPMSLSSSNENNEDRNSVYNCYFRFCHYSHYDSRCYSFCHTPITPYIDSMHHVYPRPHMCKRKHTCTSINSPFYLKMHGPKNPRPTSWKSPGQLYSTAIICLKMQRHKNAQVVVSVTHISVTAKTMRE